ncbi:MAG: class IV adenylate cyclase [Planctomycetota bacterium]
MQYEVEQKYPLADFDQVVSRLAELGAEIGQATEEVDTYFAHPARDFAKTDEALRIRRKGEAVFVTYKGPKLDETTKSRREIELRLPSGEETAEQWPELLTALGFATVAEVHKQRRKSHFRWQDYEVEASLDEVEQVGTFVELEIVVPPEEFEQAKACIAALAERLGLKQSERRSYLQLLLAQRS